MQATRIMDYRLKLSPRKRLSGARFQNARLLSGFWSNCSSHERIIREKWGIPHLKQAYVLWLVHHLSFLPSCSLPPSLAPSLLSFLSPCPTNPLSSVLCYSFACSLPSHLIYPFAPYLAPLLPSSSSSAIILAELSYSTSKLKTSQWRKTLAWVCLVAFPFFFYQVFSLYRMKNQWYMRI